MTAFNEVICYFKNFNFFGIFGVLTARMAVLSTVPFYHTIRCKGVVLGQRDSVLADGGVTHNFIYAYMVEKMNIQLEPFDGFTFFMLEYIKPNHNLG